MPVMEKQSAASSFARVPIARTITDCHKSEKFGAFVVGPQYDFRDPHRNQHGCGQLTATPSVCRIADRNSRSNARRPSLTKNRSGRLVSHECLCLCLVALCGCVSAGASPVPPGFCGALVGPMASLGAGSRLLRHSRGNCCAGVARIGFRDAWSGRREARERNNRDCSEETVCHRALLVGTFGRSNNSKRL